MTATTFGVSCAIPWEPTMLSLCLIDTNNTIQFDTVQFPILGDISFNLKAEWWDISCKFSIATSYEGENPVDLVKLAL